MLTCRGYAAGVRWTAGERLDHVFERRCDQLEAEGRSDHPAVASGGAVLSYAQLDRRANQLARHLLRQGIKSGDRVGLLFDRSVHSYVGLLAVLKANAAYVPLDPGFPRQRIDFIAEDAEIRAILSLSKFQPQLADVVVPRLYLDEQQRVIAGEGTARLGPRERGVPEDELCYVIYTSGSTGRPKGVAIEHASICNFVRVAGEVYGIREEDRVYQGMTLAFDFSVEELWVPLIAGATLVPAPPDTTLVGAELWSFLSEQRITALCCVPTLLATIERDLPLLRFLLVSGEACPRDLAARWHRPGRRLLNAYGPTEATVTATWSEPHPEKPMTIGGPLPTYSVVILDPERDAPVPAGALGEIGIGGIGLARGYVNRDDLTRKAFIPDFIGLPDNPSGRIYRTGDLGRINEDREIEYCGRIDTQVKIRGYRIELTEIESAMLELPQIAQAVVGTWSPPGGSQELVAYYTLREGAEAPSPAQFSESLRARLPRYMIPAYLEQLDAIPLLPSQKADRKKLPAPRCPRFHAGSSACVAPANPLEETLASLLAQVLETEQVSVADHFFDDLGAHSLLMARFCAGIREQLPGCDVSMQEIYLHPSVARLAERLALDSSDEGEAAAPEPCRIPPRRDYVLCGVLQLASYLALALFAFGLFASASPWISSATGLAARYLRSVVTGSLGFLVLAGLPIAMKWLLIGRWRPGRIPIWSLGYFRFWLVRQAVQSNPMVLFRGSPLYNVYLRLLGAKIGRGAVIESRLVPVCTDLLRIGDGAILRKDSLILGYKAEGNVIRTGPISIGSHAFVGEGSLLDIHSQMQDDTQLGHASCLQENQVVPAGKHYHGSPARDTSADYCPLVPAECSRLRKLIFSTGQLLNLVLLALPAPFLAVALWTEYMDQHELLGSAWALEMLGVSAGAFFGFLSLRLAAAAVVPRLLGRLLVEGRVYALYGFHHQLLKTIQRISNSHILNALFGDSSAIVHYLRLIGYHMGRIVQTGSNFGMVQRQDQPTLCSVGSGTMVADGLSMINVQMSSASFRVCRSRIGANNYLGNNIHYPPGGRTGENCLLATKTMIPIDGPVRENVGLLGSPCFEIPRAVERDRSSGRIDEALQRRRLRRKNLHNLATALMFLLFQWLYFYAGLLCAHAGLSLGETHGVRAWLASTLGFSLFTLAYFVLIERASLGFGRLKPQMVPILDPGFWRVERYWKLNESLLIYLFHGTPFRNLISRLSGVHLGKMVFDDGALVSEKTLVEIGDYCNLNEGAVLQSHSLEEGIFKSDMIRIGRGCTIGCQALVHYGTEIGDEAVVDPDSFLMKGETVKATSRWRGNPARALQSSRPPSVPG